MIRIKSVYKEKALKQITVKGHANFDEHGKDIVCAAVSATYLCTINAILSLKEKSIEIKEDNDKQIIIVKDKNNITLSLLQNMLNCLISLEKQYPKYLKLDKEEE